MKDVLETLAAILLLMFTFIISVGTLGYIFLKLASLTCDQLF